MPLVSSGAVMGRSPAAAPGCAGRLEASGSARISGNRPAQGTGPMPDEPQDDPTDLTPDLPPAAKRALAEADARRKAADTTSPPTELGGRNGPDPVRYGDWEKKGIAIDF